MVLKHKGIYLHGREQPSVILQLSLNPFCQVSYNHFEERTPGKTTILQMVFV